MEFNVLVEKRRSCRVFTDEPVTREQVEAIATAGQWAPSPLNLQPFQFIAVTDPDDVKQLLQIPEELEIAGAVLVGTPAGEAKVPPRKPPRIHENLFHP